MIYELRTYTFHPGKLPVYLKLAEEVGRPIRGNDYGINHGYWTSEFGALNQIWHLWSYDDLNARAALRAKLAQNKAWTGEYVANIRALIRTQEIRFLNAAIDLKPPQGDGHVYELRHYRTHTGQAGKWLGHFKDILPVREKYSPIVGLWHCEAPFPNNVMHLWAYDDLNARFEARARVAEDPQWREFLGKGGPLLAEMSSIVLLPTNFSPMK